MILGIGNDIIEIARIKANLDKYQDRFLNRVFTTYEQDYCLNRKEPSLHLAGRFAAKEAIVKALGTGFSQGLTWTDIEIHNEASGKPFVVSSLKVIELFDSPQLLISISHCHAYAAAVAIWQKKSH
jgi:holo-[acyl-carrier protein] synthase